MPGTTTTHLYSLPILLILIPTFLFPTVSHAKAVFAHFMIANTANYTKETWKTDITAAKASSIDAFALNAGFGMKHAASTLDDAFAVASQLDFKLFLSLDYSGAGHWPQDQVVAALKRYTAHEAYFRHSDGKPLVSTFEGFQASGDWVGIKDEVDVFFIPDWTSQGPRRAGGVEGVDGLMSWDAWPVGTSEMNVTVDEEYMSYLGERPYIMPVSPWFYTNLRRFEKNWVWRGEDLWVRRWEQVLEVGPEYVEILSWNDYGESHYVGPVHERALGIFEDGGAPFDYAVGMPHDGWRGLLPYYIGRFKAEPGEAVEVEEEVLVVWYRLSPAWACEDGRTTGNTESQGQEVLEPGEVLRDRVFVSAVLRANAGVDVAIGEDGGEMEWTLVPESGMGVYCGYVETANRTGEVVVTLSREGEFLAQMKGASISTECPANMTNWNAWVGNATVQRTEEEEAASNESATSSASSVQLEWAWVVMGVMLGAFLG